MMSTNEERVRASQHCGHRATLMSLHHNSDVLVIRPETDGDEIDGWQADLMRE